ncbi:MAG: site-specific integrase [Candidatus Binatia bacterium]
MWDTVTAFPAAIDRATPMGRRDYAIFLLIATYGLRTSEVAGLRLDDVEWRASRLCVRRPKTQTPLVLPLTDAVGAALLDYLRHARPSRPSYRELFLRPRAPAGPLAPTAVTEAFQGWTRRSRLPIPYHGLHCLRHSLAVHLLRQGTSLKTIGDLLGHRSTESTCVYLRLDVEISRRRARPATEGAAMSAVHTFTSYLGPDIAAYIALKQALGRGFARETAILADLDAFLAGQSCDLGAEFRGVVSHDRAPDGDRPPQLDAGRTQCVPVPPPPGCGCFVPDPTGFPAPHPPRRPHIFKDEVAQLLRAAAQLAPTSTSPLYALGCVSPWCCCTRPAFVAASWFASSSPITIPLRARS